MLLLGRQRIDFLPARDVRFYRRALPEHPNGMLCSAHGADGELLLEARYFSIGGGFVVDHIVQGGAPANDEIPYPFASAAELLLACRRSGLSIAALVLRNECTLRDEAAIKLGLSQLWEVMQACVTRGCGIDNREAMYTLPGPLNVRRRAPLLYRTLTHRHGGEANDPLAALDWVSLYAMAVNEENAAGGRVVTAPTNGAAGIIPAVSPVRWPPPDWPARWGRRRSRSPMRLKSRWSITLD